MHQSSLDSCKRFIDTYLDPNDKLHIADVGSYDVNGTYKPLFDSNVLEIEDEDFRKRQNWKYVGIDIQSGPNVNIVVEDVGYWLDGIDEPFDVIVSGQCLEHVRKPWVWIKQVASILKHNGLVFITAPNTWGYHAYPIDCWRIWPDGLSALFDEAGIIPLELGRAGEHGDDTWGVGLKP